MNMTIEPGLTLDEIKCQVGTDAVIRGNPISLIDICRGLPWDNPARMWTFRLPSQPPNSLLEAFMDRFESVLRVHESDGSYQSAWWVAQAPTDSEHQYMLKGLFSDLNPSTGPGFFKRAADGPRIAIWHGGIHKIFDDL